MKSDTKYEELIDKVILVPCFMCERTNKMPWLNVKDAYPCSLIINQTMALTTGVKMTPATIPAYLCEEHYIEYNK